MLKETKEIYDHIHGYIKITRLAQEFIHSMEFQRLRYLHQLGTCHYVFPCATHTRFEHSVGTYYLAGKVLYALKKNSNGEIINSYLDQIPELTNHFKTNSICLDEYVCELVKLAALCHDLGHGPFSHIFDDVFMKEVGNNQSLESHENRSCALIKNIISKNSKLKEYIKPEEIQFICDLINPKEHNKGFIYQIVSNNLNGIDVDKFDYIQRDTYMLGLKYSIDSDRLIEDMKVIDNKICFTLKVYYDIVSVFTTRYRLHKQIYSHKTVISTQFMIKDIMMILNKYINIYQSIFDMDKFIDITEEYLTTYLKILYTNRFTDYDRYSYDTDDIKMLEDAYNLWIRINTRNLYQLIGSKVTKEKINIKDIETKYGDKLLCYQAKIGYITGNKTNPLHDVYFYNHKEADPNNCFKSTEEVSSYLISDVYQEHITLIFLKDRDDTMTKEDFKSNYSDFFIRS